MRVMLAIAMLLVMLCLTATVADAAEYYYSGGGQVPIELDKSKILVEFQSFVVPQSGAQLVSLFPRIDSVSYSKIYWGNLFQVYIADSAGYEAFIDSIRATENIAFAGPSYLIGDSTAFPLTDEIVVGFGDGVASYQIDSLVNAYDLSFVDTIGSESSRRFILRVDLADHPDVVDVANQLYLLPQTEYCHPNFIVELDLQSLKLFDYYSQDQLHLQKICGQFNTASVWDFVGLDDSIVIAVIDDGVASHEDLPAERVIDVYDYGDMDWDPSPAPSFWHGMGVAGLIASVNTVDSLSGLADSTGIASLCGNAKILNIKTVPDDQSGIPVGQLEQAISEAARLSDVICISWVIANPLVKVDGIERAFITATLSGPGKRGVPVIAAAGNWGVNWFFYPAASPEVLTVGAIDLNDLRHNYSCYGEGLDLVAPSGLNGNIGDVWSLDQMGILGGNYSCPPKYSDNDYSCRFGGTSAAAPLVAGTAALIRAKDSTLTADEIYAVLKNSAARDLDWGTLTTVPDLEYGYGRVDAFRAILSLSRCDLNNDGTRRDPVDLSFMIDNMFSGGPDPFPDPLLGDCNCDGEYNPVDMAWLAEDLFGTPQTEVYPCYEY